MTAWKWRLPTKHGFVPLWWGLGFIFLLGVLVSAAVLVELDLLGLLQSGGNLWQFLSQFLTVPDWAYIPKLLLKMLETVEMGIVSTAIALLLSLPLGVLAARNTSPHVVLYHCIRNLLNLMRALPELVWALVFVSAVGLGPLPGVMALIFVTTGFLGKFLAESIEVVDITGVMGVKSTGAGWLQTLMFAVFPLALPDFIGTVLYILDHNVRSATILGLVGAGGIGYELVMSMRLFNYGRLMLIATAIYIVVTILDRFSDALRSRVI
ncbi:phosphonate ABC transporter, permease protein PhnE [Calothrix rhizosoleniae]|uniref:phosphonate ABC transporter, permease protein PhnE n=1 Tax=Calothrix rhizosoleniae TaxID=888997 RepID=UPI00190E6E8B|nr:phosphonate ABC transporter, permease protein PhnE [Calothrix rhizosoleniae]